MIEKPSDDPSSHKGEKEYENALDADKTFSSIEEISNVSLDAHIMFKQIEQKEEKEYNEALEAYRTLGRAVNDTRIRVGKLINRSNLYSLLGYYFVLISFGILLSFGISFYKSYSNQSQTIESQNFVWPLIGALAGVVTFFSNGEHEKRKAEGLIQDIATASETLTKLERKLFDLYY